MSAPAIDLKENQLRGAAPLDEYDGILAEQAAERLRVGAEDAEDQEAPFRRPAAVGVSAFGAVVRIPGGRREAFERLGGRTVLVVGAPLADCTR
jgi:hypothetical protein